MTKAFVLMTTEIGRSDQVYTALKQIEGVREVNVVAGTYDILCVVEASDAREIGRIVMGPIQRLDGVMSTMTLVAVR